MDRRSVVAAVSACFARFSAARDSAYRRVTARGAAAWASSRLSMWSQRSLLPFLAARSLPYRGHDARFPLVRAAGTKGCPRPLRCGGRGVL